MQIAEVFGSGIENHSAESWGSRDAKAFPFRNSPCTKVSKTDSLGICSFSDGISVAVVCPFRFLEQNRIFRDTGRLAFGDGVKFGVFPEVCILKTEGEDGERDRKIGKVDFLLGKIVNDSFVDLTALEVPAVYILGTSVRPNFDAFIHTQGPLNSYRSVERRSMTDDIWTIKELSAYLRQKEKTAYTLATKGEIPGFKVEGGWHFRAKDTEDWIRLQIGSAKN